MYPQEFLEEYAPILLLAANTLLRDPSFSLDLLDGSVRQLLLFKYRTERDTASDVSLAIGKARKALWCSDSAVEDLIALVYLLARGEHLKEALFFLEKPLQLFPENGHYHRLQASLLERQHQFREALLSIKTAIILLPDLEELQTDQHRMEEKLLLQLCDQREHASCLATQREAARAIVLLKKEWGKNLLEKNTASERTLFSEDLLDDIMIFGRLLIRQRDAANESALQEALSWMDQAIAQSSPTSAHYRLQAALYLRSRGYQQALCSFFKAWKINWSFQTLVQKIKKPLREKKFTMSLIKETAKNLQK